MQKHRSSVLFYIQFVLLFLFLGPISLWSQTSAEKQTLLIASQPSGANVFVNGQKLGTTPYQISLMPGNYTIRLVHPDYFEFEQNINLEKGDEMQVLNVNLKVKPALLHIKTADDVDVKIDGIWMSKGSIDTEITPGRHTVVLGGDLYEVIEQDVRVKPAEEKYIQLVPEKRFGELQIITRPHGANLRLNGKDIGEAPTMIEEVRVGKNVLEVYLDGYQYERRNVVVEDVRTTVVKIKLNKLPKTETPEPEKPELPVAEEETINPLTPKEQERFNKKYEIRNPYSWEYHDLALNYIRGIVGNGLEIAYLNKVGAYGVITRSPKGSYLSYGGGILLREYVFGPRNRGGFFFYSGAGKEKELEGYYWEIGQLVNLGRITLSFGVSQVNFRDFLGKAAEDEILPYNDLKVRFGLGISF